jgi:hypothetical protein
VKTVILVVLVSKFINTDDFSADCLILLLDVPLTPGGSLSRDIKEKGLQLAEKLASNSVH